MVHSFQLEMPAYSIDDSEHSGVVQKLNSAPLISMSETRAPKCRRISYMDFR
jgi:hypothetical protein